jgi:hypothetical protein
MFIFQSQKGPIGKKVWETLLWREEAHGLYSKRTEISSIIIIIISEIVLFVVVAAEVV